MKLSDSAVTHDQFWAGSFTDPALRDVLSRAGYQRDRLPRTALQLVNALREVGYCVGELKDLDLQDAQREAVRAEPLDRDGSQPGSVCLSGPADHPLNPVVTVCIHVNLSPSVSGDAATSPVPITVGEQPDSHSFLSGEGVGRHRRPTPEDAQQ